MNQPKKAVMRNPTMEEIRDAEMAKKTQSVPKSQVQKSQPYIIENVKANISDLKPKTSKWEPDPLMFPLPSGDTVVPGGKIAVRRITTVEENIFRDMAVSKDTNYTVMMNKLLDSCIKTNTGVNKLSVIDQIPLFLFVIKISYGNVHVITVVCNECGAEETHVKMDIEKDIKIKYINDKTIKRSTFPIKTFGKELAMKLYLPKVEHTFIYDTESTKSDEEQLLELTESITGESPDGTPVTPDDYIEIIKNLSSDDRIAIRKWLNEIGEYGTDLNVVKSFCKNDKVPELDDKGKPTGRTKKCRLYQKEQSFVFPIDQIFINIFNPQ